MRVMSKKQIQTLRRKRTHRKPNDPKDLIEEVHLFEGIEEVRGFAKRFFDIAFSLFALIITIPIWLTIPLLIRLTSKGKAIYSAERIGRGGKKIYCYKFRSMYSDADVRLKNLLSENAALREEWERNWKLKNDPRITPLGRFIRKTSIDEIPQFINTLKGELSVVGPRPRVYKELLALPQNHVKNLLSLKPGITGLWQTSGRSQVNLKERIHLDEAYLKKRNFFYDFYLVLKTVPVAIFSRGAC